MPKINTLSVIAVLCACASLSACNISSVRQDSAFFETALVERMPILRPVRAISNFDDSLACMDGLLRNEDLDSTYITSKIIPDPTGKIYVSVKDMIVTSLSKMSRTSQLFRFVDFETDPLKQDTVQNLTSLMLNTGDMNIIPPKLYVSGSISHIAPGMMTLNRGIGVSGDGFDVGVSGDLMATIFGLELHLGDFFTRTILSGIDSANEIAMAGKGLGANTGGEIRKTGVQFNVSLNYDQGVGPMVRALVDLGMIELVGKWAKVPYWQCLALNQSHPEFQRQIYDWYKNMTYNSRIDIFAKALRSGGYYTGDVPTGMTQQLRDAITKFQVDEGIVITGDIGFETYDRIMRHYVTIDQDGKFKRIGWAEGRAKPSGVREEFLTNKRETPHDIEPTQPWPSPFSTMVAPIKIDITLPRTQPLYYRGEDIVVTSVLSRSANFYCYYEDSGNSVVQIYPNPLQKTAAVSGGMPVVVPDIYAENMFSISLSKPGREEVLCAATDIPLHETSDSPLFNADLDTIKGMRNLNVVEARIKELTDGDVSFQRKSWVVTGK